MQIEHQIGIDINKLNGGLMERVKNIPFNDKMS